MADRPPEFTIRPAGPDDAPAIARLVRALAAYEQLEDQVEATADDFRAHLFGHRPAAEALVAEVESRAVGFALFFTNFSTFRGRPGLYLEDLFVEPEYRGRGIGKALIATVARQAEGRGYARLEWSVLDWNAPSIAFYRALGARPMDDWSVYRVDGDALKRLAETRVGQHSAAGGGR